jgi:ABC-type sugar transport system permease subunit
VADSVRVTAARERVAIWPPAFLERPAVLGPLLVAPAILYIAALVGYPFLLALYLSMSNADVSTTGLGRFRAIVNALTECAFSGVSILEVISPTPLDDMVRSREALNNL